MSAPFLEKPSTRREMLRNSAGFAGSALLAQFLPASLLSAGVPGLRQQTATAPTDRLAAMRAQMGAAPIEAQPLAENLTLLSGPGGNVVVLNGPDGKIVIDTFLLPAWPKLKETLDGLGHAPLKTVIDTHPLLPPRVFVKCPSIKKMVGRGGGDRTRPLILSPAN